MRTTRRDAELNLKCSNSNSDTTKIFFFVQITSANVFLHAYFLHLKNRMSFVILYTRLTEMRIIRDGIYIRSSKQHITSHQPTSDLFSILLCSENSSRRSSWFYSLVVPFSSRMTDCDLLNAECLSINSGSLSLHIFQFKTVSSSALLHNILSEFLTHCFNGCIQVNKTKKE